MTPGQPDPAAFFARHRDLHATWLRSLHKLAELAHAEHQTSAFVRSVLAEHAPSLQVSRPFPSAPTAVLAVHNAGGPESNGAVPGCARPAPILLRADMDALPIRGALVEPGHINEGVHHACGHDGHTACLLAAAHFLHAHGGDIHRKAVLLFQPAEESGAASRMSGAKAVLHDGLLSELHADVAAVFALHCWPGARVGDLLVGAGPMMGASGRFTLTFRGVGGHAAAPGQARSEPLLAACAAVTLAQAVVARYTDASDCATVAFTDVRSAGVCAGVYNVCPAAVVVCGTVRAGRTDVYAQTVARLRETVRGAAAAHGCEVEVEARDGYPATVNDGVGADMALRAAQRVHCVEKARVGTVGTAPTDCARPSLCAEDFSFLLQKRSGAYVWLGYGADSAGLHTAGFKFDEGAIAHGARWFAELVLDEAGDA